MTSEPKIKSLNKYIDKFQNRALPPLKKKAFPNVNITMPDQSSFGGDSIDFSHEVATPIKKRIKNPVTPVFIPQMTPEISRNKKYLDPLNLSRDNLSQN